PRWSACSSACIRRCARRSSIRSKPCGASSAAVRNEERAMAGLRSGLLAEIFVMSWDTLRGNKMRSALTVLGVVIGITSIVGMTSLIRGFDQSFRDAINTLGPDTIIVQKMGALSFSSGKSFIELARRPNLTREDAL